MTDREQIHRALEAVIDPELHRSIVELDMVRSIEISDNGVIDVTVSLPTPGYFHCDLVRDDAGVRLAKRHDALALRTLREHGLTPAQVRAMF